MNIYDKALMNFSKKNLDFIDNLTKDFIELNLIENNSEMPYASKKKIRDILTKKYNLKIVKNKSFRVLLAKNDITKAEDLDSSIMEIKEKKMDLDITLSAASLEIDIKKVLRLTNKKSINIIIRKTINSRNEEFYPILYIWDNKYKKERLEPKHFILKYSFHNNKIFKNSNINFLFEDESFNKETAMKIMECICINMNQMNIKEIKDIILLTLDYKISEDIELLLNYIDDIKNKKINNKYRKIN